jgi:DNA-binding NtrC family response regulator
MAAILIIDDEESVRALLRVALEAQGMRSRTRPTVVRGLSCTA